VTAATETRPTLREVVLDSLHDAFYARLSSVEECRSCAVQPAGFGPCHQEDAERAQEYDEARKQIERTPDSPEVLAVLGTEGEQS
jgi:radical SAM protein with 4Fe4S-binding SPASM domain